MSSRFYLQREKFGELVTIKLKCGGVGIRVMEENKQEFVR
jgi:hypothetical protein